MIYKKNRLFNIFCNVESGVDWLNIYILNGSCYQTVLVLFSFFFFPYSSNVAFGGICILVKVVAKGIKDYIFTTFLYWCFCVHRLKHAPWGLCNLWQIFEENLILICLFLVFFFSPSWFVWDWTAGVLV